MIDVRYFDSIQVETVFRRASSPHDQVVPVACRRKCHTGIGLDNAGNIPVCTGAFLDFLQADEPQSYRAFQVSAERGSCNGDSFQLRRTLFKFDIHMQVFGRNDVFRGDSVLVTDCRSLQFINSGRNRSNGKIAQ